MGDFLARIKTLRVRRYASAGFALEAAVILIGTIFPRLMVIGGLPTTDEGYYAYYAQLVHASLSAGRGLPDAGTLMLYPLLMAWAFELTTNHFILLRLADLLVASAASWLLYGVIERETGSRVGGALISLVFLFTMNQPDFIQYGFKNSIFAAYVPLFVAMRLGQDATSDERATWSLAGALVALAVLLRETFLPFLIVGGLAILITHGRRACIRFALGATVTGLLVTLSIIAARGNVATLVVSYRDAGVVYSSIASQRAELFLASGIHSTKVAAIALILGGLGVVAIITGFFTQNRPVPFGRFAFWLSVTLVPLFEPTAKIGYPYHFAVCLPGLAGLASLGRKCAATEWGGGGVRRFSSVVATIGALMLLPQAISLTSYWPATRNAVQNAGTGAWPPDTVVQTNYLLAADAIRKAAPPRGTLSVSGFMYALYPLTGLLPPSSELSNLSATLIKLDLDGSRFRRALLECPPDVLMTTTRTDWPGADTLTKAVVDSGSYERVTSIPVDGAKGYGDFGGSIYRKVNEIRGPCHDGNTP